jgi:hypothetical protein
MWRSQEGTIMGVLRLVSGFTLATAVAAGASLLSFATAASASTIYNFSGDFGPPAFTATVSLDVVGGQAVSGTGTISFGASTFDLSLITLTTDGGNGNYSGTTGFRDNHGTDIFGGDTVVPIDSNGLIFAISNDPLREQDALFAVSANGDGSFEFLISGTLADVFDVWVETTDGSGSISSVGDGPAPTPLPAALPLFATGLGGLGLLGWRRKRKATARIA